MHTVSATPEKEGRAAEQGAEKIADRIRCAVGAFGRVSPALLPPRRRRGVFIPIKLIYANKSRGKRFAICLVYPRSSSSSSGSSMRRLNAGRTLADGRDRGLVSHQAPHQHPDASQLWPARALVRHDAFGSVSLVSSCVLMSDVVGGLVGRK